MQLPPRPYQIEGARFLAERTTALLGDDPGLGKTREAVMAMDLIGARKRLIICPAVARLVWPAEIARWAVCPGKVHVLDPVALTKANQPKGGPRMVELCGDAPVTVVIAFDTVSMGTRHIALLDVLRRVPWDVVVIDEGHRLAHDGSQRTRRVYGLKLDRQHSMTELAARVWVLTGTPTPNHAGEIYTHARALFPEALAMPGTRPGTPRPMEQPEFIERFCDYRDTSYGRQITGSKNLPELRERMAPFVLRRRKHDVLKDLPPLDFVTVPIPGAQMTLPPELAGLVPEDLDGDELLDFLRQDTPALASLRRYIGLVKAAACLEWLNDLLESGVNKLLVFAHHRDLIGALVGGLAEHNPVSIVGGMSDPQRAVAIDSFQHDPRVHAFVGQIDACGLAITLTAAHDVAFVETSWVPGANYQAASRCHRLGQHDGVLARMLFVPGTLDERIIRTVQRKSNEIAQLWD